MNAKVSRARCSRLLPLVALAAVVSLAACQTKIEFANMVPGAVVESIQWEPYSSDSVYSAPKALRSGEISASIPVTSEDQGEAGRVSLDLRVGGNTVTLISRRELIAEEEETTRFTVTPELEAFNPLLEGDKGELAALQQLLSAQASAVR